MEIYTELNDEHKNLSLALGFFDGIHLGHREVIQNAVNFARKNELNSAIVTFSFHPAKKFNKNFEGYIITPEERFEYFEKLGVDYCWALDFEEFANIEAKDYIKEILVKNFAPKAITSGFNHNFGKNRTGTKKLLKEFSRTLSYEYFEVPPVIISGVTVSSSAIRKFIKEGNIENLNGFLGHGFSFTGEIIHGEKKGAKLGFKTANMNYPSDCVKLKFGVYVTDIKYDSKIYKGITNFGVKPTICSEYKPILETHILDFNEEIYGKNLTVEFKKFLRPEMKFASTKELSEQIKADIHAMMEYNL